MVLSGLISIQFSVCFWVLSGGLALTWDRRPVRHHLGAKVRPGLAGYAQIEVLPPPGSARIEQSRECAAVLLSRD